MEKWLCLGSMIVAGLMLLVFVLDIAIGMPFGGMSAFMIVDVVGILASAMLGYLAFNAFRDLR